MNRESLRCLQSLKRRARGLKVVRIARGTGPEKKGESVRTASLLIWGSLQRVEWCGRLASMSLDGRSEIPGTDEGGKLVLLRLLPSHFLSLQVLIEKIERLFVAGSRAGDCKHSLPRFVVGRFCN